MSEWWIAFKKRPEVAAQRWQGHAREWRIIGIEEHAQTCEAIADYWKLPLWQRVFWTFYAHDLYQQARENWEEQAIEW